MRWLSCWMSLALILAVVLAGCSGQDDPFSADYQHGEQESEQMNPAGSNGASVGVMDAIVLSGYHVQFDGREYGENITTFYYTVSGTGAEDTMDHFFLELPDCAPPLDSYSPPGPYIGTNPYIGIYGIKWDKFLNPDQSRSYSITFPGDVPLGIIRTSVKASDLIEIGTIAGPCDGGFEISGTVYVDADGSGALDGPDESGIADVTVTLLDDDEDIGSATTDENGHYSIVTGSGTYTVRVAMATEADDFNEVLAESFDPTGPTSLTVTIGPASPGNDFGFYPRAEEIAEEILEGEIVTTGEPACFWRRQLRAAIWCHWWSKWRFGKRCCGRTEFDAEEMAGFLDVVQGLYLPVPFQFTPGKEFCEALAILRIGKWAPLHKQLLRELLVAELNQVSGKGLVEDQELQDVLLAWSESVALEANPELNPQLGSAGRALLGQGIDERVQQAYGVLFRMNGNTGGGSGGGG
jgi:hypothetical protein